MIEVLFFALGGVTGVFPVRGGAEDPFGAAGRGILPPFGDKNAIFCPEKLSSRILT